MWPILVVLFLPPATFGTGDVSHTSTGDVRDTSFTDVHGTSPGDVCGTSPSHLLARRRGDGGAGRVRVIGLLDVHEGDRCHLLRPAGMEHLMMLIGRLSSSGIEHGEIGFDAYDTCSNSSVALHNLINALQDVGGFQNNCRNNAYIGVVGPMNPLIQEQVGSFLETIDMPYFSFQLSSLKDEIKAMSGVLFELKWLTVAVFATTKSLEDEFLQAADAANICIASSIVLDWKTRSDTFLKMKFKALSLIGVQVAVVLGSNMDLRGLYEMVLTTNSSIQYWLLAGLDTDHSELSLIFRPDHPVILFRKPVTSVVTMDGGVLDSYEFDEKITSLNLAQSYVEYINGCSKNSSGIKCEGHQLRARNPQWTIIMESVNMLAEDISLKTGYGGNNSIIGVNSKLLNETSDEVEIWTLQHAIGKFSKHKELQVGHYIQGKLVWDIKRINIFRYSGSGWFKIPEFYCYQDCREICKNYDNISIKSDLENLLNRIYHWKYESWVTILLTMSGIGIVIAVLTALFLAVQSCREDFEDGCQVTNVALLVAVIFSYCCTLLFMLHYDTETCFRKVAIVGIAYASMLSPILSRCFTLIASEVDGAPGHISGFLQLVLTINIFAVQASMAIYYWILNIETKRPRTRCAINTRMTLGYLSYAMLLSLLWLVSSAFCIRSRRNNREGLLLHLGSVAVTLMWLTWHLLYFLLHPRWNEFVICLGLVATASAILVVVFLPKVYRVIVSTAAREHGQVSMQPVIFASASSRSPNLSIYESINHGYNPDKDGYIVDVYRDNEDSSSQKKMTHL